jgi:hypothetical protein
MAVVHKYKLQRQAPHSRRRRMLRVHHIDSGRFAGELVRVGPAPPTCRSSRSPPIPVRMEQE